MKNLLKYSLLVVISSNALTLSAHDGYDFSEVRAWHERQIKNMRSMMQQLEARHQASDAVLTDAEALKVNNADDKSVVLEYTLVDGDEVEAPVLDGNRLIIKVKRQNSGEMRLVINPRAYALNVKREVAVGKDEHYATHGCVSDQLPAVVNIAEARFVRSSAGLVIELPRVDQRRTFAVVDERGAAVDTK